MYYRVSSDGQNIHENSVNATEDGVIPKILVKNIPFEASHKDVFELFKFLNVQRQLLIFLELMEMSKL